MENGASYPGNVGKYWEFFFKTLNYVLIVRYIQIKRQRHGKNTCYKQQIKGKFF